MAKAKESAAPAVDDDLNLDDLGNDLTTAAEMVTDKPPGFRIPHGQLEAAMRNAATLSLNLVERGALPDEKQEAVVCLQGLRLTTRMVQVAKVVEAHPELLQLPQREAFRQLIPLFEEVREADLKVVQPEAE